MSNVNAHATKRGVRSWHWKFCCWWCGMNGMVAVCVLLFVMTLVPFPGHAQVNDPTCWSMEECVGKEGKKISDTKAEGKLQLTTGAGGGLTSYWERDGACGSGWGRCYPGEPTTLKVHIPTRGGELTAVKNIGEYISAIYTWGVRIAAILAVIMIMVGGVLWMTAGAAGTLQKAKDFIRNAIIGLLLALGSYIMLQTINPDLVKLTIPRAMIVRPVVVGAAMCRDLPDKVKEKGFSLKPGGAVAFELKNMNCGTGPYYPVGASGSCVADFCIEEKTVCVPTTSTKRECQPGHIGGKITYAGDKVKRLSFYLVCKDGRNYKINVTADSGLVANIESGIQRYIFQKFDAMNSEKNRCGPNGDVDARGHLLEVEIARGFGEGNDSYLIGSGCGDDLITLTDPVENKQSDVPQNVLRTIQNNPTALSDGTYFPISQIRAGDFSCDLSISPSKFIDR